MAPPNGFQDECFLDTLPPRYPFAALLNILGKAAACALFLCLLGNLPPHRQAPSLDHVRKNAVAGITFVVLSIVFYTAKHIDSVPIRGLRL